MKVVKHIEIYDFDDTLYFTPKPDGDENDVPLRRIVPNEKPGHQPRRYLVSAEYEKATGMPWNVRGWWAAEESLDASVFDIKKNEFIYSEYLKAKEQPDTSTIMMTGRLRRLTNRVRSILDADGFKFDAYYFNPGGGVQTIDFKIDVLDSFIKKYPMLESIKMYDDRDKHIPTFIAWAEKTMEETGIDIEVIHIRGEGRIN